MTLFITSSPYLNDVDRAILNPENEFLQRLQAVLPPNPRALFICSNPEDHSGTCRFGADAVIAFAMAGMAFSQAGLGLCHALSHTLGGMFHVPHGRLNAILLPAVVELNAQTCPQRYAHMARCAGLGGSADTVAVRNLKNGLLRLRKELELPATLTQAGVDPRKVQQRAGEIVKTAKADPCYGTNPIQPEDFMLYRLLEEVTGRV